MKANICQFLAILSKSISCDSPFKRRILLKSESFYWDSELVHLENTLQDEPLVDHTGLQLTP
jgi:hypothetical protein